MKIEDMIPDPEFAENIFTGSGRTVTKMPGHTHFRSDYEEGMSV